MEKAHELTDLDAAEISGVNNPANEKRRWLVMKNDAKETLDELEKELSTDVKGVAEAVVSALSQLEPFKTEVPADVMADANTVNEWCKSIVSPPEAVTESAKSDGRIKSLLRALGSMFKSEETKEMKKEEAKMAEKEETKVETPDIGKQLEGFQKSLDGISRSVEGLSGVAKTVEELKTTVGDLSTRLEKVESAKGLKKSIDGQDPAKEHVAKKMGEGMFDDVLRLGPSETE
jgi:myosin heavy subunit